jgi:hypothetical protein
MLYPSGQARASCLDGGAGPSARRPQAPNEDSCAGTALEIGACDDGLTALVVRSHAHRHGYVAPWPGYPL